ncbi:CPSF A subunit region-domain-containing protein [Fimicolochytrium jonesii]|uniref:CPSF A subunit region-domain-containing protein n=1 Tax=Fimicolochytrium jonesii TaxID=1396493 RepID=UPI0022FEABC1|nr:CPSF A subunit region-domain-containing protein [Fimicolochytrium jonesii]KAI8825062.1 CPSF A subunit region-domain-containing protein [Fimicolochytrium jonesii]
MSSSYSLYKELLPPSGIEHSVDARFVSPHVTNLIIARGNVLQIYDVVEEDLIGGVDGPDESQHEKGHLKSESAHTWNSPRPRKVAKLNLHAEFRLQGNVTSIGVVRTTTPVGLLGMDSLLLSFKDAKMSLIEFSTATQNIVTVSIHYYEREEFKKETQVEKFCPEIRVDPQNRCAILQFYSDRLAILPLKQDTTVQVMETDDAMSKHPFQPSFVVPFSAIEPKMRNVVDMVFLYGYLEPTLAILYEPVQTWGGRLAARRDTKRLIVISLDLDQKSYPVLFRVNHLPYNCFKLIAAPSPVGGVLTFCPNAIIHVDQTSVPGIACAVNSYYGREATFPPPPSLESVGQDFETKNPLYDPANVADYKHLGLSLEASEPFFLNPDTLLVVLRTGEMIMLDLKGGEGVGRGWKRRKGGVKKFTLTRLGLEAIMPSCGTRFGPIGASAGRLAMTASAVGRVGGQYQTKDGEATYGYFFIGSRVSNAMLVQFNEIHSEIIVEATPKAETESNGSIQDVDIDDDDIYGSSIRTVSASITPSVSTTTKVDDVKFTFRICDSLVCKGPIRDAAVGEPIVYSTHPFSTSPEHPTANLEIVTCTGEARSGALGVLQCSVRPQIISSFDLGVTDMWTLRCADSKDEARKRQGSAAMEVDRNPDSPEAKTDLGEEDTSRHKYMFLSDDTRTIVLQTGEEFSEVETGEFYRDGPTLTVGTVLAGRAIIQVYPRGVFVLDTDGQKIEDMPFGHEDRWIVSCSILDPYVMLLTNFGEVVLFTLDEETRTLRLHKELADSPVVSCCMYRDNSGRNAFPSIHEFLKETPVASSLSTTSRTPASTSSSPQCHQDQPPEDVVSSAPTLLAPPESRKRKRPEELVTAPSAKSLDAELYGSVAEDMDDIYGVEVDYSSSTDEDLRDADGMDLDGDASFNEADAHGSLDANGDAIPHLDGKRDRGDKNESPEDMPKPGERTWGVVSRQDGSLEIFLLPDFEQCFYVPRFDLLPSVVCDHSQAPDARGTHQAALKFEEIALLNLGRNEKCAFPYLMGRTVEADLVIYRSYVHLSTEDESAAPVTPGSALVPKMPGTSIAKVPRRLAVRFVRVSHDHIARSSTSRTAGQDIGVPPVNAVSSSVIATDPRHSQTTTATSPVQPNNSASTQRRTRKQHLKPFERIGHAGGLVYSGVFISGERPCWVMLANSGGNGPQFRLLNLEGDDYAVHPDPVSLLEPVLPVSGTNAIRVHPQLVDGPVAAFAPLNNVNVPNGFAYVNGEGLLRICQLPAHFNYDTEWPYCKAPFGKTVHKITYHHTTQTYAIATSTPTPFYLSQAQHAAAVAAGIIEQGDELPDQDQARKNFGVKDEDREKGMYLPEVGSYDVELVSPVTWESCDAIAFEQHEHVLALHALELESKQTASGRKLFLAIGTGVVRGEDLSARGRILIYDIIDVVPDMANPHANHRLKKLFINEEKSPVTAICNVGGYLLAAIGTKVIIHTFEDNESLTGVAFIDVNMYVNSVSSIKNLILVGDILKSIWFLGFQEEPPKLALLGKDYHMLDVYGTEFLVDDTSLSFVVGDGDGNVHVMTYAPYHIQSSSGQKLIRRGDFHTGQHVSKIIRLVRLSGSAKATPAAGKSASRPTKAAAKQQACLSATLEGGLSVLIPVSEKLYKRLYGLYSKMVNNLQHPAGLNPRGFRQVPLKARPATAATATPMTGPPGPRLVLDGDLLYQFTSLSLAQQRELAKGIGSAAEKIMDDLLEVNSGVEYF